MNDNQSFRETREKTVKHIKNIFGIILKYLKYSIIDGFVVGIINFFFMLAMDMPWKIAISILMGITNLVPNFGPVIGAVIGAIVLVFYDVKQALWFLVFTIVLQIIDGVFIKPKLFGDSFGISGVWMLIAMIVGGVLFGIVGLLLAVPVVAIGQYIYKIIKEHKSNDKN